MLFSELAKRVAEKYPEVKTAFPMDCELSNVELYDPNGAIPPVDTLGIYTARQISEDMTLPLCFVCAGAPDQAAHDKIAYSAYSARTAHPFQRNGAPFRFKLSKAQQVD